MPKVYVRLLTSTNLQETISSVCGKIGLEVVTDTTNLQTNLECLENATFSIIDTTPDSNNFSIGFELGYGFRTGKTMLLIAQHGSNPINVGQQSVLFYQPENLHEFGDKLTAHIIIICQTNRIRYQKYPNMPNVAVEPPFPTLIPPKMREKNLVALADDFVDAMQYENAYQEYSRAILYLGQQNSLQPQHAYIYFKRAFVSKRLGNLSETLEDYRVALELKPDYLDAYIARGMTLCEKRCYEEALADFHKAAQLKPDFTRVYVLAGMMYRLSKKFDEAMQELNHAIQINPEFAESFYQRGILFSDLHNIEKALEDFSQAVSLHPKYTDAYLKRGLIYLNNHQYDLALNDFNHAIEFSPDNSDAYHYRGQALFEKGYREFHEQAIRDWQKAISLGSPEATLLEEKIRATSKTIQS